MINLKAYEKMADKLKVLGHPYRLCIVKGLIEKKHNVTKIQECLELPQSTVSQHLAKLKAAGIIDGERNGQEISYSVVDEDAVNIVRTLLKEDLCK